MSWTVAMRRHLSTLGLCYLLMHALPLAADPQSRSWSTWHWQQEQVQAIYIVPHREVSRLVNDRSGGSLDDRLQDHLRDTLSLASELGNCVLRDAAPERAGEAYLRLRLDWSCPANSRVLTIGNRAFHSLAPSHIHFASFRPPVGTAFERLFTRRQSQHSLDLVAAEMRANSPAPTLQVLQTYALFGFEHILIGVDHIAFLLGLMLLSLAWRKVILVITGFTIGHSITLALTVLGVVEPEQMWVEGLIGYTIAVVAIENVLAGNPRQFLAAVCVSALLGLMALLAVAGLRGPDPLSLLGLALFTLCYLQLADSPQGAQRWRPLVTLLFGLVHGFGFAGIMLEVGLPKDAVVPALAGFNLGVELGQIAIVLALAVIGRLSWQRFPLQLPANTALCCLGVFWFVNRLYF